MGFIESSAATASASASAAAASASSFSKDIEVSAYGGRLAVNVPASDLAKAWLTSSEGLRALRA